MNGQGWFQLTLMRSTWHFKVDFRTIPYIISQNLKVISSLFELDINASQACFQCYCCCQTSQIIWALSNISPSASDCLLVLECISSADLPNLKSLDSIPSSTGSSSVQILPEITKVSQTKKFQYAPNGWLSRVISVHLPHLKPVKQSKSKISKEAGIKSTHFASGCQ